MKFYILFIIILILVSCSNNSNKQSEFDKSRNFNKIDVICVDNVEYFYKKFYGYTYLSPHYKKDGTLYTCEDN